MKDTIHLELLYIACCVVYKNEKVLNFNVIKSTNSYYDQTFFILRLMEIRAKNRKRTLNVATVNKSGVKNHFHRMR